MFPVSFSSSVLKGPERENPKRETLKATFFNKATTDPRFVFHSRPYLNDYLNGNSERFSRIFNRFLSQASIKNQLICRPFFVKAAILTLKMNENLCESDVKSIERRFVEQYLSSEDEILQEDVSLFYFTLFSTKKITGPLSVLSCLSCKDSKLILGLIEASLAFSPDMGIIIFLMVNLPDFSTQELYDLCKKMVGAFSERFLHLDVDKKIKQEFLLKARVFFLETGFLSQFREDQKKDLFLKFISFFEEENVSSEELAEMICMFCEIEEVDEDVRFSFFDQYCLRDPLNQEYLTF